MELETQQVNLTEIVQVILKKWWLIVLLITIGASLAYYLTNYIPPTYQADTILFIGKEQNDISGIGISLNDLYTNDQLFIDYQELIGTRLVIEEVMNNFNVDMSINDFKRSMGVYAIGKSRLFSVSFISTDPQFAADVSNELAKQLTFAAAKIVDVENIRIVDKALVPDDPIMPNKMMNTVIAGALGLILALLVIYIQVLLDNTIQKEEDIEKITKLPVMGIIPKFKEQGKFSIHKPNSLISESYKMFRTNINYLNIEGKNQVLMITSTMSGEGKTTTIYNLAIAMAKDDRKVLLIDGDLKRPRMHEYLEINQQPGLTNILFSKCVLSEIIHRDNHVNGLDILTSGIVPLASAELLDSKVFRSFINTVRDLYDIILIDTPPVLSVTDATIISQIVDGVILVCATNETKKVSLSRTQKTLNNVNANILGVVLTKINKKNYNNYYYDYYKNNNRQKRRKN